MRRIPVILYSAALVCSCSSGVQENVEPLSEYAVEFVKDDQNPVNRTVVATSAPNSKGSIYILGEKVQTALLRDYLLQADFYDNTSGKTGPDALMDFSGELFSVVYDIQNSPYNIFFKNSLIDSLRRITFDLCTMTVDTLCSISPYDKVGIARKTPSKIIILNSPYLSTFGESDAKGAFELLGSSVKIFSTLDCMLENLLDSSRDSYRIGVIAAGEVTDPEVYMTAFRSFCLKYSKAPSECFVYHPDKGGNPLTELLDAYVAEGKISPLDAILVDDNTVDISSILEMREKISSIMNEEYEIYGPLIGKDFRIIGAGEAVASSCYEILRENKLFRLKIARPEVCNYMTMDGRVIPYSDRYLK